MTATCPSPTSPDFGDPSSLRGCTLYFDCATGLAGDMTLAALLDLGVPESFVREQLSLLPLSHWELQVSSVRKHGIVGKKVDVIDLGAPLTELSHEPKHHGHDHAHSHPHDHPHSDHDHDDPHHDAHGDDHDDDHHHHDHPHTHYADIRKMISSSGLLADVKQRALAMFDKLAAVEAALHGVTIPEVMFHEVGALDSIVDIVGVAAALSWLSPKRVVSRTVPLGSGRVKTAHGLLPIPAPATAALLRGAQVEAGDLLGELTTPTGALIVSSYAAGFGPLPPMQVLATGHGAGTRELPDRPNILRIIAGMEPQATTAPTHTDDTALWEICANIDDGNPQLFPPLVDSLLSVGANDAWLDQVIMKKGRPGTVLHVLCDEKQRAAIVQLILRETTTIGLRFHRVERTILQRSIVSVDTAFGPVDVKIGRDPHSQQILNVAPEFESVRKLAARCNVPIKQVYSAAIAAAEKQRPTTD